MPQEGPKWKKILLPLASTCPSKGNNLKPHPLSQHSRPERTPHGLTPYQPPQTCLRPGPVGQFPPTETPTVVQMEKTEVPPRVAATTMLWFCTNLRMIGQWKQNVHGDCIAPSSQKKKVQKIGMVTENRTSRGPTTPKTSTYPSL